MKIKQIKTIDYQYGDEKKIMALLYQSKEPILLKIKGFTDQFSLDYFKERIQAQTTYDAFENNRWVSHGTDRFTNIITEIQNNKPYRIFAQVLSRQQSAEIEKHVPLWQTIPFRPRYFNKNVKVAYFFGGKGAQTEMHFDREHCCILHLCLSGKKQLLLFTEAQNQHLYKLPYVGDSLIDFAEPLETLCQQFPRIKQAEGYCVSLEKGDLLFMPKNCWHYTTYLDASSSASYVFYPKKTLQIYGYFTNRFYIGYKTRAGFGISQWFLFKLFSQHYALATGKIKSVFKIIETLSFIFLLPIISGLTIISLRRKPRRVY